MCLCSVAQLCLTLCDPMDPQVPLRGTRQAPLSVEFSRQEYWSGLPFPTPGDLPDPGIEPIPLASPALTGGSFTAEPPGKPHWHVVLNDYWGNKGMNLCVPGCGPCQMLALLSTWPLPRVLRVFPHSVWACLPLVLPSCLLAPLASLSPPVHRPCPCSPLPTTGLLDSDSCPPSSPTEARAGADLELGLPA